MYIAAIVLLLLVLPLASIAAEAFWLPASAQDLMGLVGKWFTFWAVGVRLFLAGVSQVFRPQFTSEGILGIKDQGATAVVRELGFANLSIGALGLLSLAVPHWALPAAIVGGLFYGLAGLGHLLKGDRNLKEQVALASDLVMFLVLAAFVGSHVA
ncbi:MAG: DUF6790 family protein [Methyloceanibacter sp.]